MSILYRFHDIVPQENLIIGPPGRLSTKVVAPVKGSIPWPNLTDNTLVLSDNIVLAPIDGKVQLQFRYLLPCGKDLIKGRRRSVQIKIHPDKQKVL